MKRPRHVARQTRRMPRAAPPNMRPPEIPFSLGRDRPVRPEGHEPPLKVTRRSGALGDEDEGMGWGDPLQCRCWPTLRTGSI